MHTAWMMMKKNRQTGRQILIVDWKIQHRKNVNPPQWYIVLVNSHQNTSQLFCRYRQDPSKSHTFKKETKISKTVLKLFLLSSGYTYWKSKSSKKIIESFFPTCAIFSWKYNWNKAYIHFYPKLKAWGTSHFLTIIDIALVI